jgi:hypothetical protein
MILGKLEFEIKDDNCIKKSLWRHSSTRDDNIETEIFCDIMDSIHVGSFEVSEIMCLRTPLFWNIRLPHWINLSRLSKECTTSIFSA